MFQLWFWMNWHYKIFSKLKFEWKCVSRQNRNCLLIHHFRHHQINIIKITANISKPNVDKAIWISSSGVWTNSHIFSHPLDLSRSLPPSQNSLGPRTRTLTLDVITLLCWNKLFSRCYMNRYWFYCWKMENRKWRMEKT